MARNVAIGIQQFDTLIEKNCFYVDKTDFIREWWESNDSVTLITRVSRESIFSDLNNLKVVTTTSDEYATSFGFTEEEVFAALDECGRSAEKQQVKQWYDGFIFGTHADIYNPWSILNFCDTGIFTTYWANTSSNSLESAFGKRISEGTVL